MLKKSVLFAIVGAVVSGLVAQSATLRSDSGPAEIPPASYTGKQYVDSNGCVYIRAGYGTRVTWVPRVNRSRNVFCSSKNKPSLSAKQLAVKTPAQPTKVSSVKPQAVINPITAPVKVKTRVAKPVAVSATPTLFSNKPIRTVRVKTVQPQPQPQQTARIFTTQPSKKPSNRTWLGQRNSSGIRNGPQAIHPSDVIRGRNSAQGQNSAGYNVTNTGFNQSGSAYKNSTSYNLPPNGNQQIVSVRGASYSQRIQNRTAVGTGASGVYPASNNNQGIFSSAKKRQTVIRNSNDQIHGLTRFPITIDADVTPQGDAQMDMVWTNTVPRRLVRHKYRARKISVTSAGNLYGDYGLANNSTSFAYAPTNTGVSANPQKAVNSTDPDR